MRGEVINRAVIVFLVVLAWALLLVNIVDAAEPTGELNGTFDGDKLILKHINITEGRQYSIKIGGGYAGEYQPDIVNNGYIEFNKSELKNIKNISVELYEIVNGTSNKISDKKSFSNQNIGTDPNPTPTETSNEESISDSSETSKESENKTANSESIFSKLFSNIFFNIFLIILGLICAGWALYKLGFIGSKRDEEPRRISRVPEVAVQTSYKLRVELNDGTARIPDRIIEITNKDRFPKANGKSDLNGSYTFELPKDSYIINVKGGENHEDYSKEIKLSGDNLSTITLVKKQHLQVEVVDESGKPITGIYVRVREFGSGMDAPGNPETDINGIARFVLSIKKKYTASINALTQDYGIPGSVEITSSDTSKKFILKRKEGMLEITVTEQGKGQTFAGIPVIAVKKGTNQVLEFISDSNGMMKKRVAVGDYTIKIKPGASQLYEASEKQVNVPENILVPVTLDLRFSYKASDQTITAINKHYDKLKNSFNEVSAYDRCIPLFFKGVGERPLKLIERIIKRPVEFLGSGTTPDEIINHILSAQEIISEEISRIMREKSNVDFYFSIQNLPQVEELNVSDYSQEKFNKLVQDLSNYHKNHFREIGNKLHDIDSELTDLSRSLTIQPVADLWRTAQKLQEYCNNEPDARKKGVMLFINDKLLDHVKEMYTMEVVKERLKVSLL